MARVLLVDDDSIVLDIVSRMLKHAGCEVLVADRPLQALEIVRNTAPIHVVVSDIEMPEMQGTQLIREVAQLSPRTECVLMTGHGMTPVDVPDSVPVLRKPFSTKVLISTLLPILGRSAK